jgi:glycerol-3-phosphate dehydrogenase (NAD(P)+)
MTHSRVPRIAVLGAGSWGTTVAAIAAQKSPTTIWARSAETTADINEHHRNSTYLGDSPLPPTLRASEDLEEVATHADVLVLAIPAQSLRGVLTRVADHVRPWIPVISVSKGIEQGTRLRMTEIVHEILPDHPAGALSGPNIAAEVVNGYAAAATVAMPDEALACRVAQLFRTPRFRVYSTTDVVGVEIAGACKNVYAIAVGMADGAGAGENTKAMVMTRSGREMARIGEALGGSRDTFAGLAGMGDLIVTCTSQHSRNRRVGEALGRGQTVEEALASMNQVAEGVATSKVVVELARDLGIGVPIAREVEAVVHHGSTATEAYRGLQRTQPGHELRGEGW